MKPNYFSQYDTGMVIQRIIHEQFKITNAFVTHEELVNAMLQHYRGKYLVENAIEKSDKKKTPEWMASNMIQWFSKNITEGDSEWQNDFERKAIKDKWAYKPKGGSIE